MAFVEDLSVFFTANGFSVPATRTPAGGGTATVAQVIFDNGDAQAEGVVFDGPSLSVPASAWPGLKQGDGIVVNSLAYKARAVVAQADGAIVRVQLSRAA